MNRNAVPWGTRGDAQMRSPCSLIIDWQIDNPSRWSLQPSLPLEDFQNPD